MLLATLGRFWRGHARVNEVAASGGLTRGLRTTLAGDPTARETLVFVHGWPDDSRCFAELLAPPSRLCDHRCVLVDLPVCDGAEWQDSDLSFEAMAALLTKVIAAEDRPVTLVAHDWGSFVSSVVLERNPELIERLVLLDVGAQPPFTPWLVPRFAGIVAYQAVNILIYYVGRLPACGGVANLINALWITAFCSLFGDTSRPSRWLREDYGRPTGSRVNFFYAHALGFVRSPAFRRAQAALAAVWCVCVWPRCVATACGRRVRPPCDRRVQAAVSPALPPFYRPQAALRRPSSPPLLFLYGSGHFHDEAWAGELAGPTRPLCDSARIPGGVSRARRVNAA